MLLLLILNLFAAILGRPMKASESPHTRYAGQKYLVDSTFVYSDLLFDHMYRADSAIVYNGSAAIADSQRVGNIPDLVGNADMQYAGNNVLTLPGSYPMYFRPFSGKEGYVFFDNVPDKKFSTTNQLNPVMTGKRELWLVMRRAGKAGNYDAYLSAWKSGYFSDKGQEKISLSSNTSDASVNGNVPIPYNTKTLVRIKLNGDSSEVFIDNVRVTGPLTGGYFKEGNNDEWRYLVLGSEANGAYWDWYASYYKQGNFTTAQASVVYNSLSTRHEIGSLPAKPYADSIMIVRNGDTYSVDYKFKNPLGFPEDTSRTEYQFIYGGRGGGPQVQEAAYIDSLANKKRFNRKDYALGNTKGNPELFSYLGPYAWFRMTVKVYDTQGNSWRFQTAEWKVDNEYATTTFQDTDYFDHKYLADSAFVYQGSSRVSNNQRAGNIPDLIGNADMQYAGDNVAPLTGSEPKYFQPFTGKEGYIFFDNVADEKFLTINTLSQYMTGKRELWLVMRRPGLAANHEAYLNDWKAGYFSDRGDERVGLSNSGDYNISVDGTKPIPLLHKTLIRIKLNGDSSEVFINNNRVQGKHPGGYFSEGSNDEWRNLVVGAVTNNAYWDWYASYYKRGNFTAVQAQEVYTALASRHETKLVLDSTVADKSLPTLPYASDIKVVRNGDVYSVDYTFNNPLGFPEDTSRTEYQFIYGGRGAGPYIQGAAYNDTLANKKSFNRMHYAVGNTLGNPELFSSQSPYGWFRMTVKVYDTQGNSWRFQTTPWKIDNEYPAPRIAVSGNAEAAAQAGKPQVLPVPFQNKFSVQLEALQAGETEIALLDLSGKVVHRQTFPVNKGTNTLTVQPRSSLPKGMYIIQFENKGKILRVKTLKD